MAKSRRSCVTDLDRSIVGNVHFGIALLDESLCFVRCSGRFSEIFETEIRVGDSINRMPGADRLESIIVAGTQTEQPLNDVEFTHHSRELGDRRLLLCVGRVDGKSGKLVLVTVDDVTEWEERQGYLMEARRMLALNEAIAGIAHEINNPMAAVMGFAQLALRRELSDPVRSDLEKILQQAQRTANLVSELQSLGTHLRPEVEYLDLGQIVQSALDGQESSLRANGVETRLDLRAGIEMLGDPPKLERAFANIIENAGKALGDAGGGELRIDGLHDSGRVTVRLADTGAGIPPGDIDRVFDPFFTTREVGEGQGMGLSITQGIIAQHGGTVKAENSPDGGATFTIELPARLKEESRPDRFSPPADTKPSRPLQILIVDDEPLIGQVLSRALVSEGHGVEVALTAGDALNDPKLVDYDIIVLDVKLQGSSGTSLFEWIRARSEAAASRVLFVTGDAGNPVTKDFIVKTGRPLLAKPFTLDDLLLAVADIVPRLDEEQEG